MKLEMKLVKTQMENEKMRLIAYAKLLNRKINNLNDKAQNPFLDYNSSINPFRRPFYNTLVWIESDEKENSKDNN